MNTDKINPTKQDAAISSADNTETKITKDELNEEQLAKASGGIVVTKRLDKASPKLFLDG